MCRGHGGAAARSSTSTAKEPRPRHRKPPPRPRSGCNENAQESKRLGRGELRAHEALAQAPAAASALQETDADNASFEFLRILTGRGLQASPEPQQRMLELEALQLSQSAAVESVMPADAATASHAQVRRLAEAL